PTWLPPISTPFPYTTLFRSHVDPDLGVPRQRARQAPNVDGERRSFDPIHGHRRLPVADPRVEERVGEIDGQVQPDDHRGHDQVQDRKSTRLNSSHGSISYAV